MTQTAIPYVFMRGGTSRGPYFNIADLPKERNILADVLMSAIGAGHVLNIDGIGGGNPVTTKAAMLNVSSDPWADIDYLFAQVSVEDTCVDFKPTCGNILSGVAAASVEMGLYPAGNKKTKIKIRSVNTGARIISTIHTDGKNVIYNGTKSIDGVPGSSAPVELRFMDVAGSLTGSLLPTGSAKNEIDGVLVTCIDVAMPMVIARADSFGLTGYEQIDELSQNKNLFKAMETIRIAAGELMGMGNVSQSVTPKFGLLAPAISGGTVAARYFMPWTVHPSMAVTGSQCIASCLLTPGSVAEGMIKVPKAGPFNISIEHPSGSMDVIIDYKISNNELHHQSAGLVRTCRKLAEGKVFVPTSVWNGEA